MTIRRDITGQRFGRLIAVQLSDKTNNRGERFWECDCDCGNKTYTMFSWLNLGRVMSCGCLKREATIASNKRTKATPAIDRFHDGYVVSESGCWEWRKGKDENGYGVIYVDGRTEKAHRLSWEIHNGPIPEHDSYHGTMVCHHCDNPSCVNPEHLFIGLANDNVQDMVKKGRNRCGIGMRHGSKTKPDRKPRGEMSGASKLKTVDVLAIRESTDPLVVLADRFGVTASNIATIRKGKTWRHI